MFKIPFLICICRFFSLVVNAPAKILAFFVEIDKSEMGGEKWRF